MNPAALTIALAIVWAAVTGEFSLANLLLGALVGAVGLFLVRDRVGSPRFLRRAMRALSLGLLFLWELNVSAVKVGILVLTPNIRARLKPGIIAFPLTVKSDAEITLLANLITLTPGTLSVDVSDDRSTLYVHAISVPDREALVASIAKGFERRVLEVFR